MGHRGAPTATEENTPQSFATAASSGARWIELDVRRGAAGALAVHHDPLLADGTALIDLSADALAARGVWTLPEVLARLPEGLGVDLEVKNLPGEPDYDETQRVVDLLTIALQPAVGRRPLMASSFNPLTVQRLGAALDSVPTGLLHGPGLRITAAAALARELGATVLCPHVEALPPDAETIGAVHDAGLAVMVWVVDDPNEAIQFAHAGVDALCTNEPGRLVKALRMS